jgi:hypothetical protein
MTPMKLLKEAGFVVLATEGKPARWGVSTEVACTSLMRTGIWGPTAFRTWMMWASSSMDGASWCGGGILETESPRVSRRPVDLRIYP